MAAYEVLALGDRDRNLDGERNSFCIGGNGKPTGFWYRRLTTLLVRVQHAEHEAGVYPPPVPVWGCFTSLGRWPRMHARPSKGGLIIRWVNSVLVRTPPRGRAVRSRNDHPIKPISSNRLRRDPDTIENAVQIRVWVLQQRCVRP